MSVSKNEDGSGTRLDGYWHETKRPLVCLAFVAPMLLIYEASVLLLGTQATRNGVDVYFRHLLDHLGFGQYFLLPVLTGCILLGWHHTTGQPWRVRTGVLTGMLGESLLLGFLLLLVARLQGALSASVAARGPCELGGQSVGAFAGRLTGYLGAGIYEELLFRLMLLPPTIALIRSLGAGRSESLVAAVLITSFIFSAAHYQVFTFNGDADPFQWRSFLFRLVAGVFFAVLFLCRGFGITAGSHALYDILVQLL